MGQWLVSRDQGHWCWGEAPGEALPAAGGPCLLQEGRPGLFWSIALSPGRVATCLSGGGGLSRTMGQGGGGEAAQPAAPGVLGPGLAQRAGRGGRSCSVLGPSPRGGYFWDWPLLTPAHGPAPLEPTSDLQVGRRGPEKGGAPPRGAQPLRWAGGRGLLGSWASFLEAEEGPVPSPVPAARVPVPVFAGFLSPALFPAGNTEPRHWGFDGRRPGHRGQ